MQYSYAGRLVLLRYSLVMRRKMEKQQKNIKNVRYMFHVVQGDISNEVLLDNIYRNSPRKKSIKIDAIVNAAKPTLMGSSQGVHGAIHASIDAYFGKEGEFKQAYL